MPPFWGTKNSTNNVVLLWTDLPPQDLSHLGAVLCCPAGQGVHGVKETSPKSPPRPLPDLAPDTKVPRILHSNGP